MFTPGRAPAESRRADCARHFRLYAASGRRPRRVQRRWPTDDGKLGLPPRSTTRGLEDSNAAVYRYNSGIPDSSFTTIRDAVRWEDMWRRLTARHGPPRPPPPIDFNQDMALVATLGTQRTGGYTITIDAAIDRGTVVEAHVSRRAPGRECGVTAALTAPADVAIVPRREVEVRMLAHDYIADCSAR